MIPILQMGKLRLREGQLPAQHHAVRLSLPGQPRENERETQSWGKFSRSVGVGEWKEWEWIQMGNKEFSHATITPPSDVPSPPTFSLQMGDDWIVQS